MEEDDEDERRDHSYWYRIDVDKLPSDLHSKFTQSYEDAETKQFCRSCREKSDWLFTELFHSFLKYVLSWVMHQTSINGLLQRGSMFVFSREQFLRIMGIDEMWRSGRLLDLGAGDGMVTQKMSGFFNETYVTETSSTMIWRLKEKDYKILDIHDWHKSVKFDVISALNIIDRCSHPLELLQNIRLSLVADTGRALVAVVLPFNPYVEDERVGNNHEPNQRLMVSGTTFEEQVISLIRDTFTPAGFEVERFTRLPYLCEGDLEHSYYILYDAVFLLRPLQNSGLL